MTTATTDVVSKWGVACLSWLSTRPSGTATRSELSKALDPILSRQYSAPEQRRLLDGELAALEQAGHTEVPRRGRISLSEGGRRVCAAAFGLKTLPDGITWSALQRRHLLPWALALPMPLPPAAGRRMETGEGLCAAVVRHALALPIEEAPTTVQLMDALAWRGLGVDTQERLTLSKVRALLVCRVLGITESEDVKKVVAQAAARSIGEARANPEAILQALLACTLSGRGLPQLEQGARAAKADLGLRTSLVDEPASTPHRPQLSALPESDRDFADLVLTVARTSPTGRFGDHKVFISHVAKRLMEKGVDVGDVDLFKARLVSVHRNGLLSLARADLVEAMRPEDVAASETRYLSATFHFVDI